MHLCIQLYIGMDILLTHILGFFNAKTHRLNVPFGEWEKIPRLQAKTLVCLRYGKLPKNFPFRLRHKVSSSLDSEIPQANFVWRRGRTRSRLDTGDMQDFGCRDRPRTCFQGSYTFVGIGAAIPVGFQANAEHKGENVPKAFERI